MATYYLDLNLGNPLFDGLTDMQKKFAAIVIGGDGIEQVFFVPRSPAKGQRATGNPIAPPTSRQNMFQGTKILKIDVNGYAVEDFVLNNWNLPVRSRIADHMDKGALLIRLDSTATESPNRIIDFAVVGGGYVVGEILTLTGGTFGTAATLRVKTVDGSGGITEAVIETFGDYTVNPANPVASTSSGIGAGATVNLTFDFTPLAPTDIITP